MGRKALVTGAAHGIGRAIVEDLASRGMKVLATDVLREELEETANTVRAAGGDVSTMSLDVTDPMAVGRVVASMGGGPDILVHVAGGVLGQVGRPIEEVSDEDFHAIVDVNLEGAFRVIRASAPGMKAKGYGRIVVISSGAGRSVSLTGIQAYAAAKAGEIALVRQMAHELGPFGVTVNGVAPGFIRSNPATERQWRSYGAEGQERLVAEIPLRRLGTPEDIAFAVAFFCAEQAGWITGQTLSVDGGKFMQ